jgi:DNA-binding transcriptional MocR family regulator
VHPPATARSSVGQTPPTRARVVDLRPGQPWTADVVNAGWRTAWRRAAEHPLAPLPAAGLPELRAEIADHLRRMRGVRRAADHVLVTAGARDGLGLLLAMLGPGRVVGVEDPGYPSLRRVPPRLGSSRTTTTRSCATRRRRCRHSPRWTTPRTAAWSRSVRSPRLSDLASEWASSSPPSGWSRI